MYYFEFISLSIIATKNKNGGTIIIINITNKKIWFLYLLPKNVKQISEMLSKVIYKSSCNILTKESRPDECGT